MKAALIGLVVALIVVAAPRAQPQDGSRERLFDQILDIYVRDGRVYYRALRAERTRLDAYLTSLADASLASAPRPSQIAFWMNAYNALVLKTVVDHYPISTLSADIPPGIRQIPGGFDGTRHRVAGREVTLDEIEQTILSSFGDPRIFLGIGRGAVGSPRLRSEAFTPDRIDAQLASAAAECVADFQCVRVDRVENRVYASAIFSWREPDFVRTYARLAEPLFEQRSPIERAVLALAAPALLRTERAFIAGNQFEVRFLPFDWTLNEIT